MSTRQSMLVGELKDHVFALDKFSQCLDRAFRHIPDWSHFAYVLKVDSNIIRQCELHSENSPTIKLFGFLQATTPDLLVKDLKSGLEAIQRIDIYTMINKRFKDEDKVSEVITDSSSDILDKMALELDLANRTTGNWQRLAQKLGVAREVYRKFKMYSDYNPTIALVRYLYTTRNEPLLVKNLMVCFHKMDRKDVIRAVKKRFKLEDIIDSNASEIFKLGSEFLRDIADLLNKDVPGVNKGWQGLGSYFEVESSIMERLESLSEKEVCSPTKNVINWLAAASPSTSISDIIEALEEIKRYDAIKILKHYFNIDVSYDTSNIGDLGVVPDLDGDEENDTNSDNTDRGCATPISTLPFSIQATEQREIIIFQKDAGHNFGVPSLNTGIKLIGRNEEKQELLTSLTKGDCQMVVIRATAGYGKTTLVVNVAHDIIENPYGYTVVYVDSKGVLNLRDLAYKILSVCGINSFQNCPVSQVINLFANSSEDCVLILENLDHMYHLIDKMNQSSNPDQGSTPWPTDTVSSNKEQFQCFVKDLAKSAPKLKIVVTSWEAVAFVSIKVKQMTLSLLNNDESFELLNLRSDLQFENQEEGVQQIIKCCGGIPLLLCAAVVVLGEMGSVKEWCKRLANRSPEEQFKDLNPESLPEGERLDHCLGICFRRMNICSREVLVILSVFPSTFTLKEAQHISEGSKVDKDQLEKGFQSLRKFFFVNTCDPTTETYSLHPAIRSFGISEARKDVKLESMFEAARRRFIFYTFKILSNIEEQFFSTQSRSAIQEYRSQDENIREIARWCITDSKMDTEIKQFCIESFIGCQAVLLKIMRSHPLKLILCKFAQLLQKDKKMTKLYCECLVLGGAKIVYGCLCTPYICSTALKQADWCFSKVYEALKSERHSETSTEITVPVLASSGALDTIRKSEVISDQVKAQFFIKCGKCLVRYGYKDLGFDCIQDGIKLRHQCYKKSPSRKGLVMLAVGYNDFAAACTFLRLYADAISLRKKYVLPIYEKELGMHPFTATAHSQLARNYLETGDYEEATKANDIALKYRTKLLGDHQDTARSLFDKGAILSEQASMYQEPLKDLYRDALEYLQQAFDMQRRVLDSPEETAKTLQEMVDVLNALEEKEEVEARQRELSDYAKRIGQDYHQTNVCKTFTLHYES